VQGYLASEPETKPAAMRSGSFSTSGDGRLFAVGTDAGIRFFDLARRREVGRIELDMVHGTCFRREVSELLSWGGNGLVRWPIEYPDAAHVRIGPPHIVPLAFSPLVGSPSADRRIALSRNGQAVVLELPLDAGNSPAVATTNVASIAIPALHDSIELSPDGKWAASRGWHSPVVSIWNATTGEPAGQLVVGPKTGVAFTPDSRQLVVMRDGEYAFWDVATWQAARRIHRQGGVLPGPIAIAPDRSTMVVKTPGRLLSLLDAESASPLARLEPPTNDDKVGYCIFSPDGEELLSHDGAQIAVWHLRLLRSRLAKLGLDWDEQPGLPNPVRVAGGPITVEIDAAAATFGATADNTARAMFNAARAAWESDPTSALACNNFAWRLANGPPPLRDTTRAVELAEKAVAADSRPLYRNTLGVVYYRAGRHREAIDVLTPNLRDASDSYLPYDLYFLAMSYHHLGDAARAAEYFDSAARWRRVASDVSPEMHKELAEFHAEAAALLRP